MKKEFEWLCQNPNCKGTGPSEPDECPFCGERIPAGSVRRNYIKLKRENIGQGPELVPRISLKPSEKVWIRFPDGKEMQVEVVEKKFYDGHDYDHGRTYHYSYTIPGFVIEINGLKPWISFEEVEVENPGSMRNLTKSGA